MVRHRYGGFTVVEILIVISVVAIIALVVIPQFTDASEETMEASLVSNLRVITQQIALYKLEHNEQLPNYDHANRKDPSTVRLTQRLTGKTDAIGRIIASGNCGPYMLEWPANPFSSSAVAQTIKLGTAVTPPRDGTTGWYYNTDTGTVYPNSPTGGESFWRELAAAAAAVRNH